MIGENSGTGTGYLTGKFWGKFPVFPQKLGWGRGRHFWGISGTNWGWGQTRDWGIFGENSPKFPKNRGGDGEDIFGEYWGPIGDGDSLEIGEFSGKISQKLEWGRGRHFWGILGTIWGQGRNS